MPAGPVQEHQNMFAGMPAGHFGQKARHGRRVGVGQDQAVEFPVVRTDAAEDMRVLAHPIDGHLRPATRRRPAPDRIAHPAKPGFILKQQSQRLPRVSSRQRVHFGLEFF
jgi:hypothetical protein